MTLHVIYPQEDGSDTAYQCLSQVMSHSKQARGRSKGKVRTSLNANLTYALKMEKKNGKFQILQAYKMDPNLFNAVLYLDRENNPMAMCIASQEQL